MAVHMKLLIWIRTAMTVTLVAIQVHLRYEPARILIYVLATVLLHRTMEIGYSLV